jgi:hypothetical protein
MNERLTEIKLPRHPQNTSMGATMWGYLNSARESFELIKSLRQEGDAEWVVKEIKNNMRMAIRIARMMRGGN